MKNFKELYKTEICKGLKEKFSLENPMQIPKIEKVCLNMGVGEAAQDSKIIANAFDNLRMIAGQQPIKIAARKSNASFKIREGMPIGVKVTLRRDRMYHFLERLILIALPRIRDFRGFTLKNFDGRGNLSFGVNEQIIFPEIDYDKVDAIRGMDITIVTSSSNDEVAKELLKGFYFPFKN